VVAVRRSLPERRLPQIDRPTKLDVLGTSAPAMPFTARSHRWWLAGLVAAALVVAAVLTWPRLRPFPSQPLRIGYEFDPPYHYRGDDGRPRGIAVDIVDEAARRAGVRLEWTFFPGSRWTLVRDGHADLWPLLAILPEREGQVHISAPYLTSDLYLLVPEGLPTPPATFEGEVGVQSLPLMRRYLETTFPKAKPRIYKTTQMVARAVCDGAVPVGVVSVGTATSTLRLPPDACHERLRPVKVSDASIDLGIGASLRYGFVADRLRGEIDGMATDGTLSGILLPYSITSAAEVMATFEVALTRRRVRVLQGGLGLAAIAVAAMVVLGVALVRSNRRTLAAIAAQRDLEAQLHEREHLEAVGRLAGGIAHDFNNAMTVIGGYCELLLVDATPNDPRRAPLEEMQKAGVHAASLVRQLLAFSRRQIVQPVRVSVHGVLTELTPMLRRLLGEDVELVVSREDGDDTILIDPGQLQQVALNLSANARDAMPHGGRLSFAVGATSLDGREAESLQLSPGSYVRLCVTDTGVGMDEETRRHAFEPFFTTKAFGSGSGLGLATVYGVVKQAGGAARVASAPGQGTTFDLYFPATPVETPA
jgi:signal transduction histidine kinase